MFTITACDEYGQDYILQTFPDVDSARDELNFLLYCQDNLYSYRRELAIAELSEQLEAHDTL
jgi:phosphodiesterase/alkaline phosphatase D-like protein